VQFQDASTHPAPAPALDADDPGDSPTAGGSTGEVRQLLEVLRHERAALETLVYRCRIGALALAASDARCSLRASDEIDEATEVLAVLDTARAVAVGVLCEAWDLEPDVTLDDLVRLAPEPYDVSLTEASRGLRALVRELEVVQALGEDAGARALARTSDRVDTMALAGAAGVGYGADASPVPLGPASGGGRFSGRA
jgi:hypothetical protein